MNVIGNVNAAIQQKNASYGVSNNSKVEKASPGAMDAILAKNRVKNEDAAVVELSSQPRQ